MKIPHSFRTSELFLISKNMNLYLIKPNLIFLIELLLKM